MQYEEQEIAEVTHGFRYEWQVHSTYKIKTQAWDGWPEVRVIVPEGPVTDSYIPSQRVELPSILAKVGDGDEADVLEFVHTYGLLGFQDVRPVRQQQKSPIHGDPLVWIWAHAATMRFCLKVMWLLEQKDWPALAEYHNKQIYVAKRHLTEQALCLSAHSLMLHLINLNIAGIHDEVWYQGDYTHCRVFTALVEIAYWHLSEKMRTQPHTQLCANPRCGRLFLSQNAKQKYCPPRFRQSGSPCANRFRVAKWHKAHTTQ